MTNAIRFPAWAAGLLIASSVFADPATSQPRAAANPPSRWKLLWSDEFSGTRLNPTKWLRCERGKSDWNDTMSDDPRLLICKGGVLYLMGVANGDLKKDASPYLTAGITSKDKFTFTYGKVEIRARIQCAQGAWPALWMVGAHGVWPAKGEIDLMEHLNFDDIVYQTVHNGLKSGGPKRGSTARIHRDGWNTYGCEWSEDKIVFTVNGQPTFTYPRAPQLGEAQWPYQHPFYLILSMQIGGGWVNGPGPTKPEHYPAGMAVDWVRVHQLAKPDGPKATATRK